MHAGRGKVLWRMVQDLPGAEEGLSYYTLPHSQQELYANSQAQESIQRS